MKIGLTLVFVFLLQMAFAANAQPERYVVVNGQVMNDAQLAVLDRLACGYVYDGIYWLRQDGVWGYAGNPMPMGRLTGVCVNNSGNSQRRKSLSERGLLYRPGEILSGW